MTHLSPARIGLVGDVYGNLNVTRKAIKMLDERALTEIHFLGDSGFVWNGGPKKDRVLGMIDDVPAKVEMVAFVTGGNHEGSDRLLTVEPDADETAVDFVDSLTHPSGRAGSFPRLNISKLKSHPCAQSPQTDRWIQAKRGRTGQACQLVLDVQGCVWSAIRRREIA